MTKIQMLKNLELKLAEASPATTMWNTRNIEADHAWFLTKEWQEGEREAEKELKDGKMSGPFNTINELRKHLGK